MPAKTLTQTDHAARVSKAVLYLRENFLNAVQLKDVADAASASPFHFDRVFSAALGEPPMQYLRRLRLEWAAGRLTTSNDPVADIALKAGYENPESFTRAFTKQFGVAPTTFRSQKSIVLPSAAQPPLQPLQTTPKPATLPAQTLLYLTHTGPHNQMGPTWEQLIKYAYAQRFISFWKMPQAIGICYDSPEITDKTQLQYDCCVVVKNGTRPQPPFGVRQHPGGNYLLLTHKGPYEALKEYYRAIFRWLYDNQVALRDDYVLEKYLNHPRKTKPQNLLTEIYIPVP
jgi:AraC family transcriptional regulator